MEIERFSTNARVQHHFLLFFANKVNTSEKKVRRALHHQRRE